MGSGLLRAAAVAACAAAAGLAAGDGSVRVFLTTSDQKHLLAEQPPLSLGPPIPGAAAIRVEPDTEYQTIVGYGAAITDAAAWVIHSAQPDLYDDLMNLLFKPYSQAFSGPHHPAAASASCSDALAQQCDGARRASVGKCWICEGVHQHALTPACSAAELSAFCTGTALSLGLSMVRLHIGVSDFSRSYQPGNLTYADTPGDWALTQFSTAHDDAYILPVLRRARQLNPALKIVASPWTPPLWLKTGGEIGGGTLIDTAQVYETYAEYFLRFVQDYIRKGVTVDYLTLQNEPGHAGCGTMPCMLLSAAQEGRLATILGKKLAAAGLANTTRILGYDHNWGKQAGVPISGPAYPMELLNNASVSPYIAGTAWHCYGESSC